MMNPSLGIKVKAVQRALDLGAPVHREYFGRKLKQRVNLKARATP